MEMPIYECANGENASSRQKYPVFVRDVVWVPRVCEKAPNGTLQVYFQEAGKESFSIHLFCKSICMESPQCLTIQTCAVL